MLRTRAPRLPHYLTQGDGAGGEGPDAAKAEGRCVSCERGGAFARIEPSVSRILGTEGGHIPARVSEGPPHPRPGPRETGQEAREPIIGHVYHHYAPGKEDGWGTGWGVCAGESEGWTKEEKNVGVGSLFPLSLSPLLCVAVSLVCVYGFCMYACMHAGQATHPPGGDQTRGRRLPADSESSEFPRIDQASSAKPAPVQPGPAQPQTIRHLALGVGSIVMLAVTVCDVYMSVCMYYVCTCWGG